MSVNMASLLAFSGCLFCICDTSLAFDCRNYKLSLSSDDQSSWCQCENFPKILQSISQFRNLKLIAACDYEIRRFENGSEEVYGNFFHQGEQIFSGLLRRQATEEGYEFEFTGNKLKPKPPLYHHFVSLIFSDEISAKKKFRTPEFNEKVSCWMANVKIKVTEMLVVLGNDTTQGQHVPGYTVLKSGPYRPCE